MTPSQAGLAQAILEHTKTIPVVALSAGQLQALPEVGSRARPRQLTGMQIYSPETMGKRLQLLQSGSGLRRVAVCAAFRSTDRDRPVP